MSLHKDTGNISANKNTPSKPKTLMFWDLWHLDRMENVELVQGEPAFVPEASYVDPDKLNGCDMPTVYFDKLSGKWRMLYSIRWNPYTLMLAESDDGVHWQPSPQPNIEPPGEKKAPNHLFTLESGSAGGVYLDPIAADGFPFKAFAHQSGEPTLRRALEDHQHRWHQIARTEGRKRYFHEEMMLVSRDGLNWEIKLENNWGLPDWHPEPPMFGFYNRLLGRHSMTVRPGWGDRRVCIQTTQDFRQWSGPELLLQPDSMDAELVQFYGMPVFPYGPGYVGLLWVFHCSNSERVSSFNQFRGTIDCQFTYSYDGIRFSRGMRKPFIPLNQGDEHGCSMICPSSLVETDDEIRIYSNATKFPHGMERTIGELSPQDSNAIILHTLRKDGFMYLKSRGDLAEFQTKPLVLRDGEVTVNAQAPFGEVLFQITDMKSQPIEGFTFDNCLPMKRDDSIAWPLLWWGKKKLDELVNKVIRLEVRFRNANIYSFQADYHFLDAQDWSMIDDGKSIDTSLFDF